MKAKFCLSLCILAGYFAFPNSLFASTKYVSNVDYNASGQITKIEFGNGTTTTYAYDPKRLRLINLKTVNAQNQTLQNLTYTYDSAGNILSIADSVNTATQSFKYDALNRLTRAVGSYGTKNYSYDKIGNLTQKDGLTYTYGQNGYGKHAVTSLSDGTTFTYDANGNMITRVKSGVTTQFIYDVENRLTEIKKGGVTQVRYGYDGDGGRTKKTHYVSGNPVPPTASGTTRYLGSLYEKTDSGRETDYIFLGKQRIASISNGQAYYYHADHLGGTNVLTNATGVVKEINEYDPWGKLSRNDHFGMAQEVAWYYFTSKGFDGEVGLYFFGGRYYDPGLGRFVSPDAVIPGESNPQAFNRYTYCHNNPVAFIDPDGHFPWLAAIIGAVIGGAAGGITAHNHDQPVWKGILFGGVQGFFSGATLGGSFKSIADNGYWWGLARASGGFGLASQVAGAAGWEQGQRTLSYAALGTAGLYVGANVAKGVKDWVHENRFGLFDKNGAVSTVSNDSHVHINGIITDLDGAKNEAFSRLGADYLAYNPTSGPIADLTEATLDSLLGTGSVSRQVTNSLVGFRNIALTGYSHGGIIAGNTLINLGLRNQRAVVTRVGFISTQINQPRAYLSAALAGIKGNNVVFTTHIFDFSNFIGLHTNPINFLGGVGGTLTGFGGLNAHGRGPEIYGAHISGGP